MTYPKRRRMTPTELEEAVAADRQPSAIIVQRNRKKQWFRWDKQGWIECQPSATEKREAFLIVKATRSK